VSHLIYRLLLPLLALSVSACSSKLSEEERWLQQHTLNNLVFIEGGTFTMGDVGYTDTNGQHQLFSRGGNNTVLRQVTLSSYSALKYEVTFTKLAQIRGQIY
jgi:formylglycine-generating enzyme required for sulfatase activity